MSEDLVHSIMQLSSLYTKEYDIVRVHVWESSRMLFPRNKQFPSSSLPTRLTS